MLLTTVKELLPRFLAKVFISKLVVGDDSVVGIDVTPFLPFGISTRHVGLFVGSVEIEQKE